MLKFKYRNKEYEAKNIADIPNVLNKALPENTFKSILKTIPKEELKSINIEGEFIPDSLKEFIYSNILKEERISPTNIQVLNDANNSNVQNQEHDATKSNNSNQLDNKEVTEEELRKRFESIKEFKKEKDDSNTLNKEDLEMLNLITSVQEQKKQKIQPALNSLQSLTNIQKNSKDLYLKDIVEAQLIKENVDSYTRDRILSKMTNNITKEELKQILSNENISTAEMNDLQKYVFKNILSVLGEDFEFNDLLSTPESSDKYEKYQGESGSPTLVYDSNFVKNLDEQLQNDNHIETIQESNNSSFKEDKIQNLANTNQTNSNKSIEIILEKELWGEINNIQLTEDIIETILDFFSLNLDAFDRFISFVEENGLYNNNNNISHIIDIINQ